MSTLESQVQGALAALNERISRAAGLVSRDPAEISLLAVSKTFDAQTVLAAVNAGQRRFGENYLQEALEKIEQLTTLAPQADLEWHFIGPIQSNKTRAIAEHFQWVQSVDRLKIAQRLSEQRPAHLPALNILLQINISGEASKSGVEPAAVAGLAQAVTSLPRLALRGLMAIPEPTDSLAQQRAAFAALRSLFTQLQAQGFAQMDTLSMGMSADLEAAIMEGSTLVRVGSAIFGARSKSPPTA